MNQRILTMVVPVISTAHIPSNESIPNGDYLYAEYDGGWFFWVDDEPDAPWIQALRDWLDSNRFKSTNWVRLDCDCDRVDGLPTYEW